MVIQWQNHPVCLVSICQINCQNHLAHFFIKIKPQLIRTPNCFRLQVDGGQEGLRGRQRVQRGGRRLLSGVRQHGGLVLLQVRPEVLRTRAGRKDLQEEGQHSAVSHFHQQGLCLWLVRNFISYFLAVHLWLSTPTFCTC
jgi:hypothetical protein